ncbi:hypothetical protein B0H16DRAFT_265148 [Mycena metata]|uniref:F-box domain-containing protein n=1 Tax=Mycena metata TaxID=1033252 RepID=A0AAD7HRD0_9AGAR|nr:hypothetical protein B0H16DRAFT_265148 [Mycena metata]
MAIRAALAEQTAKTKGRTDADIRRLIADSELRLASLESKMAELKSAAAPMEEDGPNDSALKSVEILLAFSSLLEQRDRERITADVLRHLVAPIRSLPVELLAEIFSLTIRDKEKLLSSHLRHFQDAYRVSHICSEWQQIALCTPQLWTGTVAVMVGDGEVVTVGDGAVTVGDGEACADGLRAWLARSDPLPVPVVLGGSRNDEVRDRLPPVLDELLSVAPRWGILHLDGFLPPLFYERLTACTLDSLETAYMLPRYCDDIETTISSLGVPPRLRKLVMNAAPPLRILWAQLTELTLTCGSAGVSLDILAQCTSVVTLTLFTDLLDDAGTDATLPFLRVLKLTFRSETQLSLFLDFLSAPELENCSISFISEISWTQAAFAAFLLRSPNITHLQLLRCPLTSNDLIAALVQATSLTHLELNGCYRLDDTFLLALRYKVDTPPLVPLLHNFRFEDTSEILTQSLFVEMLASRGMTDDGLASPIALPVAQWSHVVLTTPHTVLFTNDLRDAVQELQRRGLPVEIPGGY